MRSALTFFSRPQTKWLALAFWFAVFVGLNSVDIFGKFSDAEQNRPVDYLPEKADSVKLLDQIDRFPSGERFSAVVVYRRDGGLTARDRAVIAGDRRQFESAATAGRPPQPIISRDRTTALNVVPFESTGEGDIVTRDVDKVRDAARGAPAGLQVEITGAGGFAADAIEVFDSINGTLLAATAGLVFILLVLIYRSPIFWLIPFFSVIVAEVSSRGLGYLLSELGVVVTGQSSAILTVLVFGAGTDYALLIVARYREELRHSEDRHEAVATAMRTAGPAIVASAATVIAALALSFPCRGERNRRARADRRIGDRPVDARDVHAAAGAARDLRQARVLAIHPTLRECGNGRHARHLAPHRRASRIHAAARLGVLSGPPARDVARARLLQHEPDNR